MASPIFLAHKAPASFLSSTPPVRLASGGVFLFLFDTLLKYNEGMEKCDCMKKVPGCVRVQQPKCPFIAVIPTVTVEDITGLKELADCFVHVLNINTTYYIDDKHRIITIWQGPVETTVPEDVQTEEQFEEFIKSFGLRSQYLYVKSHDNDNNQDIYQAFFFDKTGTGYYYGELYPIDNGGLI